MMEDIMKSIKLFFAILIIAAATVVYAWKAGDRILGQWSDGLWYPARIATQTDDGFNVSFDDGDSGVLPAAKIRKIDWKAGTKVQCNWKRGGAYYSGTITKMTGESIHISYDDGDQEDSTISICRSN
jgi:hypothetical protein